MIQPVTSNRVCVLGAQNVNVVPGCWTERRQESWRCPGAGGAEREEPGV